MVRGRAGVEGVDDAADRHLEAFESGRDRPRSRCSGPVNSSTLPAPAGESDGRRHDRVDREAAGRRGRVGVGGRIAGSDLEGVVAVGRATAVVFGELQGLQCCPPSILHSKLEPASWRENAKVGVGSLVVPVGPESIVVSGAVLSGGAVSHPGTVISGSP